MDLALFVLRIVVGLFFAGHGAQKLFGSFGGHGIAGTGQFFESLGMRPGRRHATAAGWAELGGGVLLVLGLAMPVASAAIIAVMFVAIATVHGSKGPWVSDGGFEYNAILMAVAFALAGTGPGGWSVDNAIDWTISGTWWAIGALGVGILGGIAALLSGRAEDATPSAARDERFGRRAPSEKRSATIAADERPGIPADPR